MFLCSPYQQMAKSCDNVQVRERHRTSGTAGPRCGGEQLLTGRISLLNGATDNSSLSTQRATGNSSLSTERATAVCQHNEQQTTAVCQHNEQQATAVCQHNEQQATAVCQQNEQQQSVNTTSNSSLSTQRATEARDSEWQWHQLGHMQVCTSLQTDSNTSTPPLSFLQAECPSCHPTNSVTKTPQSFCGLISKHDALQ